MNYEKSSVLWTNGEYSIDVVLPKLTNIFPSTLRDKSLHDYVRWLMQLPLGFRIYRMFFRESEIAYCVVSKGGSIRYPFSTKQDIIVGPYFVEPHNRGKGISKLLLEKCVNDFEKYIYAWDFIKHDNMPSISASKAAGFKYYSECAHSKYLRILYPKFDVQCNMGLYRFEQKNQAI